MNRARENHIANLEAELRKLYADRPAPLWAKIVLGIFFAVMAAFAVYLYINGLFPPAS